MKRDNEIVTHYGEHYLDYSPKCPIVIPSCGNRENTILDKLNTLSKNRIILFVYANEYKQYKKYESSKVEIVQIDSKWRSIQRKRNWIQNYLKYDYTIDHYIMVDDDISRAKIRTFKENGKTTSMYIPIENALGILENAHMKYSNTISGGAGMNISILSPNLYNEKPFYQIFCISNKWVRENPNCMFRDLQNVSEDNVIFYDCWKNEQPYHSFEFLYFECNGKIPTIASSKINIMKNNINALRIMKENGNVHWSNSWKCWGIRLTKKINVNWNLYKSILDKKMKNWENLENDYDDRIFRKTFKEIEKIVISL